MGVHTARELMKLGISRGAITYRTRTGIFERVLPSVYSDCEPTYLDRCSAVVKWKPGAVLSHDTAAWLWGLLDAEPAAVHATVPVGAGVRGPDWVRLHRRIMPASRMKRGLPVAQIERCFVDVATTLSAGDLERFFDANIGARVDIRSVAQVCRESVGLAGIEAVRRQLRTCCPGTRSEPERVVARALTARNFSMSINTRVGRFIGDLVDYRARVVEIDGREFHISPDAFNNDRKRQNVIVLGVAGAALFGGDCDGGSRPCGGRDNYRRASASAIADVSAQDLSVCAGSRVRERILCSQVSRRASCRNCRRSEP